LPKSSASRTWTTKLFGPVPAKAPADAVGGMAGCDRWKRLTTAEHVGEHLWQRRRELIGAVPESATAARIPRSSWPTAKASAASARRTAAATSGPTATGKRLPAVRPNATPPNEIRPRPPSELPNAFRTLLFPCDAGEVGFHDLWQCRESPVTLATPNPKDNLIYCSNCGQTQSDCCCRGYGSPWINCQGRCNRLPMFTQRKGRSNDPPVIIREVNNAN